MAALARICVIAKMPDLELQERKEQDEKAKLLKSNEHSAAFTTEELSLIDANFEAMAKAGKYLMGRRIGRGTFRFLQYYPSYSGSVTGVMKETFTFMKYQMTSIITMHDVQNYDDITTLCQSPKTKAIWSCIIDPTYVTGEYLNTKEYNDIDKLSLKERKQEIQQFVKRMVIDKKVYKGRVYGKDRPLIMFKLRKLDSMVPSSSTLNDNPQRIVSIQTITSKESNEEKKNDSNKDPCTAYKEPTVFYMHCTSTDGDYRVKFEQYHTIGLFDMTTYVDPLHIYPALLTGKLNNVESFGTHRHPNHVTINMEGELALKTGIERSLLKAIDNNPHLKLDPPSPEEFRNALNQHSDY